MAHKCNVARFDDGYLKAFRRLGMPAVMSTTSEDVKAESIRLGGKMEFLLERSGPSCYVLNISCIMNGSFLNV